MKISFHGACREVTGSCILIESGKTKFLFDCGMFQGEDYASDKNADDFTFNPKEIDFVLLSHAHIDHCGRLPKLYRDGFRGKVYCTEATADLTALMLEDSVGIVFSEAEERGVEPLFSADDVAGIVRLLEPLVYDKKVEINSGIKVKLGNSGHILGSSFFEVWLKEGAKEKKIVYSGDLGKAPARIIKDPDVVNGADLVFIESTYARDTHESKEEGRAMIKKAIIDCVKNKGTLIIPVFAMEKSQEILYELNHLAENGEIPRLPMFLDSPLAIRSTEIYRKYEDLYDKDSKEILLHDNDLFDFPGMEFTLSRDDSMKINSLKPPKVILAGGGMCVGGRIQHHLKFNLDNEKNHVLLVAYQAKGTLGRKLMKKYEFVDIHGSRIPVRAKVSVVNSYSAHADHGALMSWLKAIKKPVPKNVFIVHGAESSGLDFQIDAGKEIASNFILPEYGKSYEF
ncbi:MBL fold metallo-hydrolase [Candidatus Falkowbacteria bacterium]|nr:MBL fold metallo-hydrolase [Candidatus Falkowbacteria bacterium]NCT54601.1 MBL fold metallo-hydrolase [Candidatus Falkowbacteria bacterium]